jgi:hypothetical protein
MHLLEDSPEPAQFKFTAMQELGKSFATVDLGNDSEIIASLATISLIIFYDTVDSARGQWGAHLGGAWKLITASGGLKRVKRVKNISRILRVLIWYAR